MPVNLTDKAVRDLVKKAELIGWKLEDRLNGKGHPVLHHAEKDIRFTISQTPSDWRSFNNAIASLERLAERKLPRPGKRRKGRSPSKQTDFSLHQASKETTRWNGAYGDFVASVKAEHHHKVLEFRILSSGEVNRTEMNEILRIVKRIHLLEELLVEFNQPFEKFNPVVELVTR